MIRHIETNVFESHLGSQESSDRWTNSRTFLTGNVGQASDYFSARPIVAKMETFRDNIIELRRKIVINFDCRFLDLDLRVKLKIVWFWILRLNPLLILDISGL